LSTPFKIAILGTGAVGGYFGGLLAKKYFNSRDIQIIFITRPATEKVIREKGLKIISQKEEQVIFPNLVTSDTKLIGHIDLLICCVKSYDLERSLQPLSPCINKNTVILPLLNGVDAKERIESIFPGTEVWYGCVYIVTRLLEPGIIRDLGNIHSLYFGSEKASPEKLNRFFYICKEAGIDAFLSENIQQTIWEKFLFISPLASLTSYLDLPIGPILKNEDHKLLLLKLLKELKSVADAKGIYFPENIVETTLHKMEKLPYETTSSMHSDFQKGGKTEYRSLTKYIVRLGKELSVETPLYEKITENLKKESR
jgi:2-dehydropantoate 2-reductase